jgi:hypothetical protein
MRGIARLKIQMAGKTQILQRKKVPVMGSMPGVNAASR